jgi:hypothetical protein
LGWSRPFSDPRHYDYATKKTRSSIFTKRSASSLRSIVEATPELAQKQLSEKFEEWGAAFVDPDEELSIPNW